MRLPPALCSEAIMLVEVDAARDAPWRVLFANEAWEQAVGRPRPHDGGSLPFWDVFQVSRLSRALQGHTLR